MKNTFTYQGVEFEGYKQLKGKQADFDTISKRIKDTGLTPEDWNCKEFYLEAEKVGAAKFDLFLSNGLVVIPGQNYLFRYQ